MSSILRRIWDGLVQCILSTYIYLLQTLFFLRLRCSSSFFLNLYTTYILGAQELIYHQ